MFNIIHFLQINRQLSKQERWLPGENNLLSFKWINNQYGTKNLSKNADLKEWVENRLNNSSFLKIFNLFLSFEIFFASTIFLYYLIYIIYSYNKS